MTERANEKLHTLNITPGDYVYMLCENKGAGQKLQHKYTGPYIIDRVSSPHMVYLKTPENGQVQKNAVHLDRLKMAFIRAPDPKGYLCVKSCETDKFQVLDRSEDARSETPGHAISVRKSCRNRQQPDRFGVFIDPSEISDQGVMTDRANYYKIKRVLGQRSVGEISEYLVQFAGEPAENALWLPFSNLNSRLQQSVLRKPPPIIKA